MPYRQEKNLALKLVHQGLALLTAKAPDNSMKLKHHAALCTFCDKQRTHNHLKLRATESCGNSVAMQYGGAISVGIDSFKPTGAQTCRGGPSVVQGQVTISNSQITNNVASNSGGGIYVLSGTVSITVSLHSACSMDIWRFCMPCLTLSIPALAGDKS